MKTFIFALLMAPVSAAAEKLASPICELKEFPISRTEAIKAGKKFASALDKSSNRKPALSLKQLNDPESVCTLIGKDCKDNERRLLFLRYKEDDGTPLGYLVLAMHNGKQRFTLDNAGWTRTPSNLLAERMRELDCD